MKKTLNTIAIFYVVASTLLFKKIIATEIGLIVYSSTTILLMIIVLYYNYRKDKSIN